MEDIESESRKVFRHVPSRFPALPANSGRIGPQADFTLTNQTSHALFAPNFGAGVRLVRGLPVSPRME
jgi:hypothetical protein